MLNHTVWSNGRSNGWSSEWSKWLLTLPMLMPIVFALSILVEAPASAAEGSSSELPEFQNHELDSDQLLEGFGHDFLSNFVQLTELESNAIDSTTQTHLDDGNITIIETEVLISPPLSVAELSTSDTVADVPSIDHSVTDQQTDESFQPLEENPSVVDRLDLNLSDTQEIGTELDAMGQVTSVTQLSDVQPTDWAYQALQSLVERYGCIVGYPDSTYRGQSALTRYEFAAGLNACLDRISELLAASTADLATQEDLATLQRLQAEFAAELATIRARVDGLEFRVAELEENQFSTTTRLGGTAIFAVADVFGESGSENVTVGQYRVSLDFLTSFTGRDLLLTSFWAGNVPALGVGFNLPGTRAGGIEIPSAEGTLSSQFGANTNNNILLITLAYTFPIGEQLLVTVAPGGFLPLYAVAPTLNPYLDDNDGGTGAISVFGERNAIYSLGSGGGLGLNYFLSEQLRLSAGYLADGLTLSDPRDGRGLFNGGYSAIGQITWTPAQEFSIAATYINAYFPGGRYGFNYNSFAVTGTAVANTLAGQTRLSAQRLFDVDPVITNSYGVQATFQPSPGFAISGWFGATYARLIEQGDGQILNYALTFAFPDLGQEGNLLGLVVGAEPYLTRFEGGSPDEFETDIPFHIEAFYRHQINSNISITPGVIWLTAPNQDNANGNDFIATVRTTFKF
ncbi:iron uptake porin [Egbenema bharatensis]|uniref:iron uptake porin n=1 Tax=Egbenema bharatensis TaxID=3463334 RepID=UPI003A886CD0